MKINPEVSVFVINLERDFERRIHMENMLKKMDIDATFVRAVDGKTLTSQERKAYDQKKALRIYGVEMLDNELGCYLSHYRIYRRMIENNLPFALIFEDDIDISPTLPSIVNELVSLKDPKLLVVRLHSMRAKVVEATTQKFTGKEVKSLQHGTLLKLNTHTLGAGAYLISHSGAKRMLHYGERIFMPIDQTMDRFWENGITPYIVRPFPVRQLPQFTTSIGDRSGDRNKGEHFSQFLARRCQRLSDSVRKRLYFMLH